MIAAAGPRMGPVEWFLLVSLSVLWGATYFFVELALVEVPPLTLVLLRVAIAAFVLHLVRMALGVAMPSDVGTPVICPVLASMESPFGRSAADHVSVAPAAPVIVGV